MCFRYEVMGRGRAFIRSHLRENQPESIGPPKMPLLATGSPRTADISGGLAQASFLFITSGTSVHVLKMRVKGAQ